MSPVQRWPLHPQPGPVESLSSWLNRLADLYEIPVKELLTHNLGLVDLAVPADLDYDPPMAMLTALAERTGVEFARLRSMTLAGWEPWLFDKLTVPIQDTQPMFDAYVRGTSVLLAPGEAGRNQVNRWKRWPGPWLGYWPLLHRACPVCAADPRRGRALVWRLPLMTGCVEHGCRLEDATKVALSVAVGREPNPAPLEEPLATVDRYTYEGLTTGRVTLPGRSVHAGVWFRLLRCLLDEVSLSLSGRTSHGRATLEQVWQAAGREERAGLTTWRPYEHLKLGIQETMLHAAGTALRPVAEGTIIAFGRLAATLRPDAGTALRLVASGRLASTLRPEHRHIYDGDRSAPHRSSWQEAMDQMEAALDLARTDRDAARQLLVLLTLGCRTLDRFEEQRAFLFGVGVPVDFLPSARELGRVDLA